MEKDQYTQQLLLVITRKSTWSSKWPWRSNWAIFPIHILIEFHIAIIISYIFRLTSRSNGQWWKPMEIRSLLNKSKGVSACRPSIEAWPTLLVTCGFDSKWSQWLSQFISSSMVFPPNCYISIYLYIPVLILFRYIYTPLGYPAVLWTSRDFKWFQLVWHNSCGSQVLRWQMWQPNFAR